MIDKDRKPTWRHDVDGPQPEEVAAMLAPLEEELDLAGVDRVGNQGS